MTVGTFDPRGSTSTAQLNAADKADFLKAAAAASLAAPTPQFGLAELAIARLAPLAQHAPNKGGLDWSVVADDLTDAQLLDLIRLFTLAEQQLPGWEAGAASPVVPLAALLRKRGGYPADLNAWIKSHSRNRFLPYGNLMDRL